MWLSEWHDEEHLHGALIVMNQLLLQLEASKGKIDILNMSLDASKIERDELYEKVEVLEAIKNF